jgi:hypothetical protein
VFGPVPLVSSSQGGTAAQLRVFVQRALAPRVRLLEGALVAASRQVQAYCAARGLAISLCFEQDIDVQAPATQALAQVFTQQALVLTALSTDLAVLPVPSLAARLPGRQIDRLIEDLALCSAQLADLLWDHVHAIAMVAQAPTPRPGAALVGLAYGPRVRSAMTILRRADGWLETVDHETGADVRLPGFAHGAPPIVTQLGVQ